MSVKGPHIKTLLRDGISQVQRQMPELDAAYFQIDERSFTDLLKFAKSFAHEILFYNSSDTADGNWTDFFDFDENSIFSQLKTKNDFDPHLALFLAFLQIFQHLQSQINELTGTHLDFYYQNVLGLQREKSRPDYVHVIFELAKTASLFNVKQGTLLDAGKGEDGQKLIYQTTEDTLVNKATLTDIRSIYFHNNTLHFANVANSSDGLGAPLEQDSPFWKAFGNSALPTAKVGFTVASPILLLKEGSRIVTLTIKVKSDNAINWDNNEALEVFYTGEKGWIGPYLVVPQKGRTQSGITEIIVQHTLGSNDPSVVVYDAAKHLSSYATEHPLMQFLLHDPQNNSFYKALAGVGVQSIQIAVDVKGVTSLHLENDFGELNPKKPFQPFGPQPVAGSTFYIGYEELLHKNIDDFSFKVTWQDPPSKITSTHYNGYSTPPDNTDFHADIYIKAGNTSTSTDLFNSTNAATPISWPHQNKAPVIKMPYGAYSGAFVYRQFNEVLAHPSYKMVGQYSTLLFSPLLHILVAPKISPTTFDANSIFAIVLRQNFGHKEFPTLFALEMKKTTPNPPNPPYTPVIQSIQLEYKASSEEIFPGSNAFADYSTKPLAFFHTDVFGIARQHGYIKDQIQTHKGFAVDKSIYLLPQHQQEGSLLLGFESLAPGSSLSCLFQVAEGTADPETTQRKIKWSVLCQNEWRSLTDTEILVDETNGLLQSGIIRFVIPKESDLANTLLPAGKIWIRAQIDEQVDGVCDFLNIHPQAVKAVWQQRQEANKPLVLEAETISKMVVKDVNVKKLLQPYASFAGSGLEGLTAYRTRVSERLRHKNRAVNAWDYERMVLQAFPEVYKVKCLNHTGDAQDHGCCAYISPGEVCLILVPDLRQKISGNILQPKISLDTLTKVEALLNKYKSMFVDIHVQNPQYEQVKLDFKVRFKTPGDFGYRKSLLQEDLKKYLTPWAYNTNVEIRFGGSIHKSVLMNFIEDLDYVDVVTEFRMDHYPQDGTVQQDVDEVQITDPKSILVSSLTHNIAEYPENPVCI